MEVKPFKAFRFDEAVVGEVGNCVAPPYDVISSQQQEQLYQKSQHNIVRIIKGKTSDSDTSDNNQYTRAADYLNTWIEKGALKEDSAEAIYAYVQDFELAETWFQRDGFIALARLDEFGKIVRPHEQTLDKPKIDRLNLARATDANFGLVFMIYEDQQKIADKIIERTVSRKPLIDFVDEQNVRHRLFDITDKNDIDAIAKMMLDKKTVIADGHHRYETALNYRKETNNPAARYQMAAFVNTCHDGLIVMAIHRLINDIEGFNAEKLIAAMEENFEIIEFIFDSPSDKAQARQEMLSQMKAEQAMDKNAFGIYAGGNIFHIAVLKNKQAMDAVAAGMSEPWKSLDVSVLHKLILEKLLGIDEKKLAKGSNVEYVKDTGSKIDELIARVDAGEKQAAFFMNPPKMEQIKKVADEGEKMPQKSTYFYPKMYTGLTINKL